MRHQRIEHAKKVHGIVRIGHRVRRLPTQPSFPTVPERVQLDRPERSERTREDSRARRFGDPKTTTDQIARTQPLGEQRQRRPIAKYLMRKNSLIEKSYLRIVAART